MTKTPSDRKQSIYTIISAIIICVLLVIVIFSKSPLDVYAEETVLTSSSKLTIETNLEINNFIEEVEEQTLEEKIDEAIDFICLQYNVDPYLVKCIVWNESRYTPDVSNGDCVGLMQISTYWHAERAEKLGVSNLYDPVSNILVGVDFLAELFEKYEDPVLVMLLYGTNHNDAFRFYEKGYIPPYTDRVLKNTEKFKEEGVKPWTTQMETSQ